MSKVGLVMYKYILKVKSQAFSRIPSNKFIVQKISKSKPSRD
jgi:hypothetical protein